MLGFPRDDGAREVDVDGRVGVGVGGAMEGRELGFGGGGPILPAPVALTRTLRLRALMLARGAVEGVSDDLPSFDTSDMEEGGREIEGVPMMDCRLMVLTVAGVLDAAAVGTAEVFIAIFLLIYPSTQVNER